MSRVVEFEATTLPPIGGWFPTMSRVIGLIRLNWITAENLKLKARFERENGRQPEGEEVPKLMQQRIDYFRRMGLR